MSGATAIPSAAMPRIAHITVWASDMPVTPSARMVHGSLMKVKASSAAMQAAKNQLSTIRMRRNT